MRNAWFMLRWGIVVGLFGSLAGSASADGLVLKRPATERYTLPNGLRVVLQPDPRRASVVVATAYAAGSRDEPPGYRELAHLVEHLTYRGSRHLEDREGLALIERSGGIANGFTTADHTVYYARVPAQHLPTLLWIESERMAFTLDAMSEDHFDVELGVVRNEWRQRSGNGDLVPELVARTLHPKAHPYAQIGDRETDLDALELDHARWFFQRYYRPDNATLVVAGRFDPAVVKPLIARYFGPIVSPKTGSKRAPAPALRIGGHERLVFRAPVTRGRVSLRWLVPCAELRCLAELVLLGEVLARDNTSHLTRALSQAGVAVEVVVDIVRRARHVEVALVATLPGESTPLEALSAADQALAKLGDVGPSAASLQAAQHGYAAAALDAQQSPLVRALGLATDEPDPLELLHVVMGLSPAEVQAAVARYLPRFGRLEVLVTRDPDAETQGELEARIGALNPEVAE